MKIKSARLFGVFFILSFLSYAIGLGLMDILQNLQTQPFEIVESKVSLVIGAILIAIFHTLFNLGLLIVMFNVLKTLSKQLSIIYLVLGSFGTFMLALGGVFLLLPIPISENIMQGSHMEEYDFSLILNLSLSGNFYSYQLGMILWGFGGLIFCYLLYKSKLVPVIFPILGSLGYLIFIVGCILELFGKPFGVMFSIPGGLFEIFLSIWLIVKGFDNSSTITNSIS